MHMRAVVYLPEELAEELKRCQQQEKLSASAVMQKALRAYLYQHKRSAAVAALDHAAAEAPISKAKASAALDALADDRQDGHHRA